MEIALLGGTGDIGEGLALRWARDTDHPILIGSRQPEKAEQKAAEYHSLLSEAGHETDITGYSNEDAADRADVIVASIPPDYVSDTVASLSMALDEGDILVSPAVQMTRDAGGFDYDRPDEGSVAEEIAASAPDSVSVVGAFQNLAAGALADLENELNADVVVTGDDPGARENIRELAEEIHGIRAVDGGALSNSGVVESVTPLLINVAMNNDGLHDLGIKFE